MDIVEISESSGNYVNTGYTIISPEPPDIHYISDIIIELPLVRCILVALQIIAIILASIGNGLLIYIILKHWRKHKSNVTAYLVLNLALTEFIRTIFHQPMRLMDILLPEAELTSEFNNLVFCKAAGFFSAFFAGVAFHTIVGISIERLLLICYPLKAKGILTVSRMRNIIIYIWIIAFVATLPLPVFFTFIAAIPLKNQNVTFCLIDIVSESNRGRIYYIILFFLYYAVPVVIITTSYTRIFCTLNKELFGTRINDESVQKVLTARKSLAKIMLSIAVIFTLFQGPYFLTFLCLCLGVKVHSNHVFLLLFIEFLPLISSVLNPLIYTANSTSWRKGILGFRSSNSNSEEGEQKRPFHKQISMTKFEGTFRLKPINTKILRNNYDKSCIAEVGLEETNGTPL